MYRPRSARISERELLLYREELKQEMFRQVRKVLASLNVGEKKFTQKDLAKRLGVDEGSLSRRLRGENDMRMETLSDLARGLECRIKVSLVPLATIKKVNEFTDKVTVATSSPSAAAGPYSTTGNHGN